MKITGWAVLAIGVLIAAFGLFSLTSADPNLNTPSTSGEPGAAPFPIANVLLPFAAVAMIAGVAMIVYGGSGVIKTKNLTVRN